MQCCWEGDTSDINGKFNVLGNDFHLASVWMTWHCQYGWCYFKHRTSCTVIFIVNKKSVMSSFSKMPFWEVNLQNVHKAKVFFSSIPEKKSSHLDNAHLLISSGPYNNYVKWLSQILSLTHFSDEKLEACRWKRIYQDYKASKWQN